MNALFVDRGTVSPKRFTIWSGFHLGVAAACLAQGEAVAQSGTRGLPGVGLFSTDSFGQGTGLEPGRRETFTPMLPQQSVDFRTPAKFGLGGPTLALAGASPRITDDSSNALLGGADQQNARFGGFLDAVGAYTYPSPAHWSRAVGRLQLTGQGELTDQVKWKIGGRIDVDPVYFSSNFYPDSVNRNQRFSAIWGENYLDFSVGEWDFRVGAQHVVWGEVVGLFFADVVSARDMREFLLPSFDIIRIPQWAARAEYFAGDSHVEFVWIPVPTFDRIGKPGAEFYPTPLPSPIPPNVAALFPDPERPARKLGNSNFGVRANTLAAGWDLAAFYYRSFSGEPTFYQVPSAVVGQPLEFQGRYDRIWQTGGTVTKDFGEFVMRGEAVYTHGQGYSVSDLSAAQLVVTRPTLDYVLSVEFLLPNDTRVNIQGFQRAFFGGGGSDMAVKSDGVGASVFISTKLTSTLEPQILWIQNFKDAGGLIRPRLNWHAAKNTNVGFGLDIFTGPANGFFGRYNDRDRLYAEVRYDF
jgi:hypothetical protein